MWVEVGLDVGGFEDGFGAGFFVGGLGGVITLTGTVDGLTTAAGLGDADAASELEGVGLAVAALSDRGVSASVLPHPATSPVNVNAAATAAVIHLERAGIAVPYKDCIR